MKKVVAIFLVCSVLTLAVGYTAYFFIFQSRIINANLEKVIQYGKSEIVSWEKGVTYLKDFSKIRDDLVSAKTDFLEVNLARMEVYFYQAGVLKDEFPISAKGDPQGWGGSAAGLYRVISGNEISYSIAAEVYMPYALRYYGKYYIHGEPYFPSGAKRYSDATGGCIQLTDKDAKAIFNLTEIDMPVLVVDKENDNYHYLLKKNSQFPQVSAKTYLVADLDSGLVFTEKNAEEQLPIASLTKLMTAVVVAENVDLRKSVQINSSMLTAYGTTTGLDVGKNFRVVELFYPLLTESSNDAAQALSYFLSRQKTIKLINEKAKAILMTNTQFVTPDGFSAENVSTAQDLFT